jgi:CubicO group peptidase (beta-lactamase class C family)
MKYFKFFLISILFVACVQEKKESEVNHEIFSKELDDLQTYFKIPGLAVSVSNSDKEVLYQDFKGFADLKNNVKLDSTYLFPIASLTKDFSGIAMMKLVEEGKLSLDDPIIKYIPQNQTLGDSILVKHILSHTSQGELGKNFYYSYRFGTLTQVIQQASGMPFEDYLNEKIFQPLKISNTYLLKDSAQIREEKLSIAKPYVFDNGVEAGFIDFGFSASAGIVSDLQDLRKLSEALDINAVITQESKEKMFTGINPALPYGYGIFKQTILGIDVVWAYGQYDCYSSLFLKVPEKDLTLILLANNSLMSDPARLIYGDISDSRFALSFLKHYVLDQHQKESSEFKRKELLAQALSESFMARFEDQRMKSSADLLEKVFSEDPNYVVDADLSVLHNIAFLKDIAFYKELGEFSKFDQEIETLGAELLKVDTQNPYANVYLGNYYLRKGDNEKARVYLEKIVNAKNFSRFWYTNEAINALKSMDK